MIYNLVEFSNQTEQTKHDCLKETNYTFNDNLYTEIFGYDGTTYYMNQSLDMKGKTISNAIQLSALLYVYALTLSATNIEFSDVATSGATAFIINASSNSVMSCKY